MKHYVVSEQWLSFMNKDCVAMADADQGEPVIVDNVVQREKIRSVLEPNSFASEHREDRYVYIEDALDAIFGEVKDEAIFG